MQWVGSDFATLGRSQNNKTTFACFCHQRTEVDQCVLWSFGMVKVIFPNCWDKKVVRVAHFDDLK